MQGSRAAFQRIGNTILDAGNSTGDGGSPGFERFRKAALDIGNDTVDRGGAFVEHGGKAFGRAGDGAGNRHRTAGECLVETVLAG
ncbi:hypothetical protein D3C71_592470 [compost metagenome]